MIRIVEKKKNKIIDAVYDSLFDGSNIVRKVDEKDTWISYRKDMRNRDLDINNKSIDKHWDIYMLLCSVGLIVYQIW